MQLSTMVGHYNQLTPSVSLKLFVVVTAKQGPGG